MAIRRITGTGATNGATIGNGGTPGGQAFSINTPTGTATATWSTSNVPDGVYGKSIRLQAPATGDTFLCSFGSQTAAPLAAQVYAYIASLTGVWMFFQFRIPGQNGGVRLDASRRLQIINAGGTTLATGTVAVPLTTEVRFDVIEDPATTSTGSYTVTWSYLHDLTPQDTITASNANLGTTDPGEVRLGKFDTTATVDVYLWGFADNIGATGLINPPSWSAAGTVAGTSATALSVTAQHPVSASVAAASTASLAVTAKHVAAGTAAASTTTAATVKAVHVATGTAVALSGTQLTVKAAKPAAGTSVAASSVALTVTAKHAVAGVAAAVTTVTLNASPPGTSGTVAATSSVTLAARINRATVGTVTVTSTDSLSVAAARPAAGTVAVVTGVQLDATVIRFASGVVTAVTSVALTATVTGAGRDITVTARLVPTTYRASLTPSAYTARIGDTVILGSTIYQHVALTADHDISADTVKISLNGGDDWYALEHVAGTTDSTWRILLGDGQALDPAADATALVQINDDPEVVIVNAGRFYVTTA